MKKQISLFAIAAAAVAVSMPQAHAQFAVGNPSVPIDTSAGATNDDGSSVNITGLNPEVITVSGNIPEFIQFQVMDDQLELGNIGGGQTSGIVNSVSGSRSLVSGSGTEYFNKDTNTPGGQGDAFVEFVANTDVKVVFDGDDLIGGINHDHVLPTAYRVAIKGKVKFANGVLYDGPGSVGQNPATTNIPSSGYGQRYASYTPVQFHAGSTVPAGAASLADMELVFAAGGPSRTGAEGGVPSLANARSGFLVMAEVTRNGTNDPKGAYTTTLNMNYFKL
jgi:hypothetical protein